MSRSSPRLRRELKRFVKFSVVGTIGAVVDFGIFNILQTLLGAPYLLSGSISFGAAIASNYYWNRYWTYPDSRSKSVSRQMVQFLLVNMVGLFIRVPILAIAEKPMIEVSARLQNMAYSFPVFHLPQDLSLSSEVMGRNLALVLAVLIVLFWNFGANRVWTYSDIA